jgi:SAM-dependent methyltransferase
LAVVSPSIYAHPELYEAAFSFRDVAAEVDTILRWCPVAPGTRILEVAAGPAAHAIELARRGLVAAALDLSPAMVRHAARRARQAGVDLDVVVADMSDFTIGGRFGLVLTMAGAIGHLADEVTLASHFRSVARHLAGDGQYLIETTRPGDGDTRDRWRLSRQGRRYDVHFSPDRLTVRVREADGRARTFTDRLGLRLWTARELADLAGDAGLEVAQRHRWLAGQSRLVLVFRKGQSSSIDSSV